MCYNHRKLRMDVVNTLTFKQIFLKMKIFFKKLGYRFWTKILRSKTHHFHTKLPCQSEAKFIRNRMRSTKWTYHKERSFARDYLIFSKISFHFRTFYEDFIWCAKYPNVHIHTFYKCWSFISGCFFPVSIFNLESKMTLRYFWDVAWVLV